MTKQLQMQADWVSREDQEFLGRSAREWATDPANKFCNPAAPNEMDRQLLSLFGSIEECRDDIDAKLETLHQTWKRSGFLTKSLYSVKTHYLFRGVGTKMAMRANSRSVQQMVMNWNRVQNIYNGQDGSAPAAKAWIGPNTGGPRVAPLMVEEPISWVYTFKDGAVAEGPLVYVVLGIRHLYRKHKNVTAKAAAAVLASHAEDRLESRDDGVSDA